MIILKQNKGWVLPTEILAKEEKMFWNKLFECKYSISVSPKIFWSGSVNNYRISYGHSEIYSCISITHGTTQLLFNFLSNA